MTNSLASMSIDDKLEMIGKALGYVFVEVVLWLVGIGEVAELIKGAAKGVPAISKLSKFVNVGVDTTKFTNKLTTVYTNLIKVYNRLEKYIGKTYTHTVTVIKNGVRNAVALSFLVEDLGNGLVGIKGSNLMNFVSKYGDDAIDEAAKLAKTQDGNGLIKLAKGVDIKCRQAVLSGSTCAIPQVMIDSSLGVNNLNSELRRFAGKTLNLVDNSPDRNPFTLRIPDNVEVTGVASDNNKGFKWIENGVEYRVSNPRITPSGFNYLDGYVRISKLEMNPANYNKIESKYLDAKGYWWFDKSGHEIETHFHITSYK